MNENKLALMPLSDVQELAQSVSRSRLYAAFADPNAALTLMMMAQAEGIHPMLAVRRYDVIQGRPAMKSDAMLSDFMAGGGRVAWLQHEATVCEAEFRAPGLAAPLKIKWTLKMAQDAGLAGKPTWKQYPRQMLRARVVSEGVRMAMPGVVAGVYTPEEVGDFDSPPPAPMAALTTAPATIDVPMLPEPEPTPEPPVPPPVPPQGAGPRTAKKANAGQIKRLHALAGELHYDHKWLSLFAHKYVGRGVGEISTKHADGMISLLEATVGGQFADTPQEFQAMYVEVVNKWAAEEKADAENPIMSPTEPPRQDEALVDGMLDEMDSK